MTDNSNSSASDLDKQEGYVVDAENAAEMARLMIQDRLLTQAMGGLLPEQPDLSAMYQVLDIACGSGGWLLDLVTQYPHLHGIGVDISQLMIDYATSLASSQQLPNVQFRVMDVTQPLQFPDSTFDLVNARIMTGFLSTQQWSSLLDECARIMRPGALLRLTEAEWGFTNSAALDALTGYITRSMHLAGHTFSPHGRTFGTTPVLRLLQRQAGYQAIASRAHVIDFSAGTALYESSIQNHLIFQKLIQPFIVQMGIASQAELEQLYTQMEAEFQSEDFCGIDYFLTVWGRKPE